MKKILTIMTLAFLFSGSSALTQPLMCKRILHEYKTQFISYHSYLLIDENWGDNFVIFMKKNRRKLIECCDRSKAPPYAPPELVVIGSIKTCEGINHILDNSIITWREVKAHSILELKPRAFMLEEDMCYMLNMLRRDRPH